MRLLDVRLGNLLHHKVGINVDFLAHLTTGDTPLSGDSKHADRRLSVDKRIDTLGHIGESELVCGLVCVSMRQRMWANDCAYLSNGFLIGNGVGCRGVFIAGLELVADKCWAQRLDHQLVVVQGCDDDGGVDAVERCGDMGGRHFSCTNSLILVEGSSVALVVLRRWMDE